ncbi:nuclear transcription factor Y subunit C-2-like [Apium graveolens]|uniref:nuclear transcription factor Y subunit C-2-like n=1 Tax=Apium graveolens TaxID=4045 RepID=UPI003D7A0B33
MDESEGPQQQQKDVIESAGQMTYGVPHYHAAGPGVATGTPLVPVSAPTQHPTGSASLQQPEYYEMQLFYQQQQLHLRTQLQTFWANQVQETGQTPDFKNYNLPLARIKKIMKADEDVRMISSEVPVIFAKACEMFILELTMRSWLFTEENKRRTLQKNDIAAAISSSDIFDFLVDIIPGDELKEEGLGITKATIPLLGPHADSVPYYYVPQQHAAEQAGFYPDQQAHPQLPYMSWQQTQEHKNQEENGN